MTASPYEASVESPDPPNSTCRRPANRKTMLAGAVLIIVGLLQLPYATQMWRYYYRTLYNLPLDEFFSTVRQIPDNTFVICLGVILWIYHRAKFHTLGYLLLAIAIGSVVIGATKVVAGRVRPEYSVQMNDDEYDFLVKRAIKEPSSAIAIMRHDQWMFGRGVNERPWFGSPVDSFPSGHAFGAAVIGVFLIRTFPAARVLWFILAVGVALSRVRFRRHWPEDTMIGAGLGLILANLVFSWQWPYALMERLGLTFYAHPNGNLALKRAQNAPGSAVENRRAKSPDSSGHSTDALGQPAP